MNSQQDNTPVTAAENYHRHRESIAILLDELRQKLEDHGQRAAADPKNWGYPGDLGHIVEKLREINDFLR